MFLTKKIDNFRKKSGEVFASVEVIRRTGVPDKYNFLLLKREGSGILVLDRKQGVDSSDVFSDVVRQKIPVVLSISGSGVLLKKMEYSPGHTATHGQLVRNLLPNADPTDFLLEEQKDGSGRMFCALIRKNIVEEITLELIALGVFVLDVGIGIFMVAEILPLMDEEISKLNIQEYKLVVKDRRLLDYSKMKNKLNNSYRIGGEELPGDLLPVFANAFRYFVLKSKVGSWDIVVDQRNEFRHYKTSSLLLKAVVAVIVLLLSVNYISYYFLSEKTRKTDVRLISSRKELRAYHQFTKIYNRKKGVMMALGINNDSYVSILVDKMVQRLPPSMYLTNIQYNPKLKRAKGDVLFLENTIIVSGRSSNVRELYKWINDIDKLKRIANVKLSNYNYVKKDGLAGFDITITIRS